MSTDTNWIPIFHPARLTEGELHRLMVWARQVAIEAPALAQWWGDFAVSELNRRSGGDAEPQTLNLDVTEWSNKDVGEAVAALTKVILAAREGDTISKVLEATAVATSLLARERLGKGE